MSKKRNIEVGDIILIPVGNNYFNVSKVIYLSKQFKHGMCIGVYNIFIDNEIVTNDLNNNFSLILYTSTEGITDDRWKKIGNIPLKENEKGLTKRIVAGKILLEDSIIGTATTEDYKIIPKELALGLKIVENKIINLYQNKTS
jgi:hypothetical protein